MIFNAEGRKSQSENLSAANIDQTSRRTTSTTRENTYDPKDGSMQKRRSSAFDSIAQGRVYKRCKDYGKITQDREVV